MEYTQEEIRRMAHEWWDWDILPPYGMLDTISNYITEHPDEFRGYFVQ